MMEHAGRARASSHTADVKLFISEDRRGVGSKWTHSIVSRTCFLQESGNGASVSSQYESYQKPSR